jgi:lipoprotein NlpD
VRAAPIVSPTPVAPRHKAAWWQIALIGLAAVMLAGCGGMGRKTSTETRIGDAGGGAITGPAYRVKAGDTLRVIAARSGIDQRNIVEWNQLASPDRIYAGQVLRLTAPDGDEPRAASRPQAVTTAKVADGPAPARARPVPAKAQAAAPERLRWQWPTSGRVVERFAAGDPNRKGVKISGKAGQSIVAAESGTVVYSGSGLVGYGQLIIIKHNNNYLSAYGHNRKLLAQQGDQVTRGTQIAEMGLAGGVPLLHFEIRRDGDPVDPLALLPRR